MPEKDAENYRFDVLNITKVWPHPNYPLHKVGKMTWNRNPENNNSEVEQSAFKPSHLVPRIESSIDKRLHENYEFNATNASKPAPYGPGDQTQHEKVKELMGNSYDSINENGWNYNSPWKTKNPYHDEPIASNKSATASACLPAGNGANGSYGTASTCGNTSTNAMAAIADESDGVRCFC
jgi:hypothetical protein